MNWRSLRCATLLFPVVFALAIGLMALLPSGAVHAYIIGGACGGVSDCSGQTSSASCPTGCTGSYNYCTATGQGTCFADGGSCMGTGCPVSCSCAGTVSVGPPSPLPAAP